MQLITLVSVAEFIGRLSVGRMTAQQVNTACAYLRAKRIAFYDTWSRKHCLTIIDCQEKQKEVLIALRMGILHDEIKATRKFLNTPIK